MRLSTTHCCTHPFLLHRLVGYDKILFCTSLFCSSTSFSSHCFLILLLFLCVILTLVVVYAVSLYNKLIIFVVVVKNDLSWGMDVCGGGEVHIAMCSTFII